MTASRKIRAISLLLSALAAAVPANVFAGAQVYEPLAASVQAALSAAIADQAVPYLAFTTEAEAQAWLAAM